MNDEKFKLQVHYVAAGQPYKDEDANRAETLAELKPTVMSAFNLEETTLPDGTTITYWFHHGQQRFEDLSITLGSIAGDKKVLQLQFVQQVVQG